MAKKLQTAAQQSSARATPDTSGPVSRENAEHYRWGVDCDAWYLVNDEQLSVIEEFMPPGAAEIRHHHQKAQQFFYIVSGEVLMEANKPLTPEMWTTLAEAGITEVDICYPDRDDVGVIVTRTLEKDAIRTPREALIEIYRRLLDRIEQSNFDVLSRRIRLTAREKLQILAEASFKTMR